MKSVHKNGLLSRYLCVMLFYIPCDIHAQLNLVNNPSFEVLTQCPDFIGQINRAVGWDTLRAGGGGTVDLFNICANTSLNPIVGVPVNDNGLSYQIPKSGNSYIRLLYLYSDINFSNIEYREYAQNVLLKPLAKGKEYCIGLHIALNEEISNSVIDRIGVYFDNGSIQSITPEGIALAIPQVTSPDSQFITYTPTWHKIAMKYQADEKYTHLALGNFLPISQNHYYMLNGQGTFYISAYYIDDVSVIPSDLPAWAGEDTVISPGDSVFIGRQPEIGLECVWTDLQGNVLDTVAGIWVSPTQTTTYIVTQDLCGNIKKDTVTVYVFPASVAVPLYLQSVRLFPNPAQQNCTLSLPQAHNQRMDLRLLSPLGAVVWEGAYTADEVTVPLPDASGVYFLEIQETATGGRVIKKIVRE